MKLVVGLILSFIAAVVCGDVVVLNEDNFAELTGNFTTPWFIKFYAPWCPHCKKMAATWEDFSDEIGDDTIKIGEIDATQEKKLKTKFGVKHFPTLLFFKDGNMYKYEGVRSVGGFKSFVESTYQFATTRTIPE